MCSSSSAHFSMQTNAKSYIVNGKLSDKALIEHRLKETQREAKTGGGKAGSELGKLIDTCCVGVRHSACLSLSLPLSPPLPLAPLWVFCKVISGLVEPLVAAC